MHSASQLTQYSLFSGDYTTTPSKRHGAHPTEFGAGIVSTAIYGKESALLPKELSFAVDSLFDGRLTGDMAQITFQQQNGEVALQRMAEIIDAKQFDQVGGLEGGIGFLTLGIFYKFKNYNLPMSSQRLSHLSHHY